MTNTRESLRKRANKRLHVRKGGQSCIVPVKKDEYKKKIETLNTSPPPKNQLFVGEALTKGKLCT
jgi:hypothetical protein